MKNEVNVGDLTPQQRLDLARGTDAAPVGERDDERAAIHQLAFELGGTEAGEYLLDLLTANSEWKLAKLRAGQEPVAVLHKQHGFCWYEGRRPAPGTELYAAPQPSAGVVMPDALEMLTWLRGAINCNAENDTGRHGVWFSTKHPMIQRIDSMLARLNGKEVGRG